MDMLEAMRSRHTVRAYTDKSIPNDIVSLLTMRIAHNNQKYDTAITLRTEDTTAFGLIFKLTRAKGVRNFLIMSADLHEGEDPRELDERLGCAGADLMLYAQTLGLNTWWAGGTYSRATVAKMAKGNRTIAVIAIGYGAEQGEPHQSKSVSEVCKYDGEAPAWFTDGVKAVLLAPTAFNRQDFFIEGHGRTVSIRLTNETSYSGADLGLVKYHFSLGAGADNFDWA
ncbi:nitroreductase family protein [Bifidobacterium moukalabense]|uniref:nitroreductase family protein n=1 Tax=Bifidobacterium moukalabense TaxID=1333651 RepID=UPI0010F99214|nr:nitroreductase family protein [Bifidobacterium moukalabense]